MDGFPGGQKILRNPDGRSCPKLWGAMFWGPWFLIFGHKKYTSFNFSWKRKKRTKTRLTVKSSLINAP